MWNVSLLIKCSNVLKLKQALCGRLAKPNSTGAQPVWKSNGLEEEEKGNLHLQDLDVKNATTKKLNYLILSKVKSCVVNPELLELCRKSYSKKGLE